VSGAARNIPNAGGFDHWDTLLREFRQGTSLDLRNKQITEISPKLWNFTDLTVLDLSQNPALSALPQDIDLLTELKTLRVCGNGLLTLPSSILNLKNLVSLELNQNKLTEFLERDSRTGAPITAKDVHLQNLSFLSLNSNNLSEIPSICKYIPTLK
jgi:Leucine-rich repeat (LRR) protein